MTDPEGHPLHECQWTRDDSGQVRMTAARLYLDWGQWVGLKPGGLVNISTLDLSHQPGWHQVTRQDLRMMAAGSLGVPLTEVEFFYRDDDLHIASTGKATIRQRKDAFYVLQDGTFAQAQFMACMAAMNWDSIDFLPVVELFQSLLPGTGSATFELIRALYDDQNPCTPVPLRYRGIPTYPSGAAFGLFSAFFTPRVSGRENPFFIFMDQIRSHEVQWFPTQSPPLRYVDSKQNLCLTIKNQIIQKVTRTRDSAGASFQTPGQQGFTPLGRKIEVHDHVLRLIDFEHIEDIPLSQNLDVVSANTPTSPTCDSRYDWRNVFTGGYPEIQARDAFGAILLYPDNDRIIGELPSQPFLADFFEDYCEQTGLLSNALLNISQVLIENFDAALSTCWYLNHPCEHTVKYSFPEYAQKHVQGLWNRLARESHLDWLNHFRLMPFYGTPHQEYSHAYDLMYVWFPFTWYLNFSDCHKKLSHIVQALNPGGLGMIGGPGFLAPSMSQFSLQILECRPAHDLPSYHMHKSLLQKASVRQELTLWIIQKNK